MQHDKPQPTRGGSRPGAGRPRDPNAKIAVTKKLDREIVAYLASCDNATAAIEDAVKRSKGYHLWLANEQRKAQ